jgi:isopenicillin N synthase-like dioxygenase
MDVRTVDYQSPHAAREFTQSLRETGFAVLENHPIPVTLIHQSFEEWGHFFDSPDKNQYTFDPQRQSGYFPFRSENAKDSSLKDLKEFYHYYPWGELPAQTREKTPQLYRALSELGAELLGWIEDHTPAQVRSLFRWPLTRMIHESPMTLLRAIHYPPLSGKEEEGAVRAAAHEDINLITLLPAATAPGLQVKDIQGVWHDVPCDPGTIVINSGDMLKEASGGYYPSTTHQVMNPRGEAARKPRYSMPLFLHPRPEAPLSERYLAKQYLDERLTQIGLLKK